MVVNLSPLLVPVSEPQLGGRGARVMRVIMAKWLGGWRRGVRSRWGSGGRDTSVVVDCSLGGEQGGGERFPEPGGVLGGGPALDVAQHAPDVGAGEGPDDVRRAVGR